MSETTPITISVSLPEWTLAHWERYGSAQQDYIRLRREAKQFADSASSRYHGAKALVESGYVHFIGDEATIAQIKRWIAEAEPPLKLVGWLVRNIADAIEAAFDVPLV